MASPHQALSGSGLTRAVVPTAAGRHAAGGSAPPHDLQPRMGADERTRAAQADDERDAPAGALAAQLAARARPDADRVARRATRAQAEAARAERSRPPGPAHLEPPAAGRRGGPRAVQRP